MPQESLKVIGQLDDSSRPRSGSMLCKRAALLHGECESFRHQSVDAVIISLPCFNHPASKSLLPIFSQPGRRQLGRLLLLVPPVLPELFIFKSLLLFGLSLLSPRVHCSKPFLSCRVLLFAGGVSVHAVVHSLLRCPACEGRCESFVGTACCEVCNGLVSCDSGRSISLCNTYL